MDKLINNTYWNVAAVTATSKPVFVQDYAGWAALYYKEDAEQQLAAIYDVCLAEKCITADAAPENKTNKQDADNKQAPVNPMSTMPDVKGDN